MYGEDSFSLQQELRLWRKAFVEKYDETNLEEIDCHEKSNRTSGAAKMASKVAQIAAAVSAMPFLSDKRLVIVKDFLATSKADQQKKLIPTLENLPDSTVLVLAESTTPDKRTSLFKHLNKNASLRLFEKPKGAALSQWVIRKAEKNKGQMDSRTAAYLIQAVGNDLWQLANEVQKLALFAKNQAITPDMIDQLVTGSIEQSIFTMTDQLAKNDVAGVLKTMRRLQNQGQEAPYLFAMITRQFRIMLEMKALAEQRTPQNAIASKMSIHPYVVKTTLGQCRNFSHSQLKRALRKLLEVDRRLKTGGIHLRQREEEQYLLAIERILLSH
jgi:DNA polymerase III subunit delta